MPVEIQVFYPEVNTTTFTEADIEILRMFEPIILKRAVALFASTSSYQWERDAAVTTADYARLVKRSNQREILSEPVAFLRRCTQQEFEELLVRRSFEVAQEDKTKTPSA